MADDLLEDEWWKNEDEGEKPEIRQESANEGEESDSRTQKETKKKRKKRKHDVSNIDTTLEGNIEKPKKRRKHKLKNVLDGPIDSGTLWKYFANVMKGQLSQMELDELKPNEYQYLAGKNPTASLGHLATHFKQIIPRWQKDVAHLKEKYKGCPILLIISGSARRSVEINRAIKSFKTPDCKTVKLFAKHFKMEDQQDFLAKNIVHIGIGTPKRILDLLCSGSLKLEKLKYVVIDWSFKDAKQRKMVEIEEVQKDLNFLLMYDIFPRLKKTNKLKFSLF